jgi:hypothetical protein
MDVSVRLKRLIMPLCVPCSLSLSIAGFELPDKTSFVRLANKRAVGEVCQVDVK